MSGPASAGLHALAVAFPEEVRTNEHWHVHHPELVARAQEHALARLWKQEASEAVANPWELAMRRWLDDPFRGSIERRVLGTTETSVALEVEAARAALEASGLRVEDIDLMIVGSFRPDTIGVGNAAFVARELGLHAPAFNLESACSSSVVALHTACGLVQAGHYRRILCVTSCTYTRDADAASSLSWFLGDGAGAFIVGPVADGLGLLGFSSQSTTETCDTWRYDVEPAERGPQICIRTAPETGRILGDFATPYLRDNVLATLGRAGLSLDDVDFFVFNTPTAWFLEFAETALGIEPGRALSTYPLYSNVGPALMPVNLHHAASTGRIAPGDRVLLYSIGSVSTASAALLRWGDVALGPMPRRPSHAGPPPPLL
jgi:3-oxoacyl-[acyl-carrier-protein] synthase III